MELLLVLIIQACINLLPTVPTQPVLMTTQINVEGSIFTCEVADTEETRERGLMYRTTLGDNACMVFVFPKVEVYPFWMKNTLIPLDIVWLDQDHHVVAFNENTPPCKEAVGPEYVRGDMCPVYNPKTLARYVLEFKAGKIGLLKLKLGDKIEMEL